jgi:hypothetical protein
MLPSFLGIVAQGGGGPPPPPVGVLISGQTLDVTYLATTPAETFTFSGGSTYLTNGESVTSFSYSGDPTTAFSLDLTGLTALTSATVSSNAAMTSSPSVSGLAALITADFSSNATMYALTTFSGCSSINNVRVDGCNINEFDLTQLCTQLLAAPSNGYLQMQGGTNFAFDSANIPYEIVLLQADGWAVTYNSY